jgi:hypothetical protein
MELLVSMVGVFLLCVIGIPAVVIAIVLYLCKLQVEQEPPPPPKVKPEPRAKPEPKSPDYLRRWPSRRRTAARRELYLWQEDYDRLVVAANVARRAGGLHGSSTAAPGSGG